MFKNKLSLAILMFLIGFVVSGLINSMVLVSGASSPEQLSPSDHIHENQIKVYEDKVILNVKGAQWARLADTNSMDPLFDKEANVLQLVPHSADEIKEGDIISYVDSDGKRIIHRVVYKGFDDKGTYFIVKGDNNPVSDPGKIRFDQIDRVLFGIIY